MRRLIGILAIAALAAVASSAHAAETVKLTVSQTANADGSVTPVLTWCTEANASTGSTCTNPGPASACTASGDWTGTKAAQGSETLAAIRSSKSWALSCSWPGLDSFGVTWTPPSTNDDGTPLTDLAGYRIFVSKTAAMSSNTVYDVMNPGATSTRIGPGLAPGTYYVVMSTINAGGTASRTAPTPPVSRTIGSGVTVSQQGKVSFPSAPSGIATTP